MWAKNDGKLTLESNFGQLITGFTHLRAVFNFNQRQNAEGKNSRDISEQIGFGLAVLTWDILGLKYDFTRNKYLYNFYIIFQVESYLVVTNSLNLDQF